MIEKEFVPYQESLELKELGFDEPCLKVGNPNGCIMWKWIEVDGDPPTVNINDIIEVSYDDKWIQIPTFNQVFRWFREKYHLIGGIEYIGGATPNTTWWDIYVVGYFNTDTSKMTMKYQPYEEAELECLRKLIEIVKNKQQ